MQDEDKARTLGGGHVGPLPPRQRSPYENPDVVIHPPSAAVLGSPSPSSDHHTLPGSLDTTVRRPTYIHVPFSHRPLKLHIRMPTRSRPEQALSVLRKYKELAGCPVTLEVVIDRDDSSWYRSYVAETSDASYWKQLAALGCHVTTGDHHTKVEAVNGGTFTDWDVLLLASDDMVPVVPGYGIRICHVMAEKFPMLDGALYFDDTYAHDALCTLPIFGRRLYDQFGYVYFPEYRSFFCDNEQTEVLKAMGRLHYTPEVLIEHRHPVKGVPVDDLYLRNNGPWAQDELLYRARKTRHFDAPKCMLSILIATMPRRRGSFERLTGELWSQALAFPRQVEILADAGPESTGVKRNRLLVNARGEFVAFVDDDDRVSPDYVARILAAIHSTPGCDCVEFHVSVGETNPKRGHCSIQYQDWRLSPGDVYTRCPNHLSPVRRELALRAGFPDKTVGEDFEYSMRLRPHLKVEAKTGAAPFYFYSPTGGA